MVLVYFWIKVEENYWLKVLVAPQTLIRRLFKSSALPSKAVRKSHPNLSLQMVVPAGNSCCLNFAIPSATSMSYLAWELRLSSPDSKQTFCFYFLILLSCFYLSVFVKTFCYSSESVSSCANLSHIAIRTFLREGLFDQVSVAYIVLIEQLILTLVPITDQVSTESVCCR